MAAAELVTEQDRFRWYWIELLTHRGLTLGQAERLADDGCDVHGCVEALDRGCDPDLAFLIYS